MVHPKSPTSSPDQFLHHTWTIRTISPFATPLFSSPHCSTTQVLEDQLTRHLRCSSTLQDELSQDGTYVTALWIHLNEAEDNKPRIRSRHLHLDIYEQDAPTAQIICCFANFDNACVESFSFLLSRGPSTTCGILYQWFESNCACAVGLQPFCPTPTNVVSALTTWTSMDAFYVTHGDSSRHKPLVLSFGIPNKDLEKISFSIPPLALTRLCRLVERVPEAKKRKIDIEGTNQEGEQETSTANGKESVYESSSIDSDPGSDAPEPESSNETESSNSMNAESNKDDRSSVLQAIQRFAWEAFHINIESFPMIRASSSVAVLGCDGRCRFMDGTHLDCLLGEVTSMISNQVLPAEEEKEEEGEEEAASAAAATVTASISEE